MRKRLYFLGAISFLFAFCAFFPESVFAVEKINDFTSNIYIKENGVILVEEVIVYDFGDTPRHGIYRDISTQGDMSISVKTVTDGAGNKYPYTISHQGSDLKIKIGDPNKTVTGIHTYDILYEANNVIGFFKDHDELYWNVTGNDWSAAINSAEARITLPSGAVTGSLQFACYTGSVGSKQSSCFWNSVTQGSVNFESSRTLNVGEGLTIVLGWPKGIVKQSVWAPLFIWLKQFWPIFIPLVVFIFLFVEWWKRGRDFPLKKPIIAEYEPPGGFKPAELGLILKQKIGKDEISATIIDLAVRGYIKIREIPKKNFFGKKDYELIKVKDFKEDKELSLWEKDFLTTHFLLHQSIKISKTAISFKEPSKIISDRLTAAKYFVYNPQTIRKILLTIGLAILFGPIFFGSGIIYLFAFTANFSFIAMATRSFLLVGLLFLIFSFIMPKRTKEGADIYWRMLGFKEYINTAEKHRLQFAERENLFEKYLPYAIIFGLSKKWAKAFEGIYKNQPSWYEGSYTGTFATIAFTSSLNNAFSTMRGAVSGGGSGGSGFGGGGFSGGGGGGGGGGSW